MSEFRDPNARANFEPISETQKQEIGASLLDRARDAIAFNRVNKIEDNYWIFKTDGSSELIDMDDYSADFVTIVPHDEDEETTRSMRVVIRKIKEDEPIYTEDYKISFLKNTERVTEIRKATVTREIIESVTELSGVTPLEAKVGAGIFALTKLSSSAIDRTEEIGMIEIEAQWALSEGSSSDGGYLMKVLRHMEPGGSLEEMVFGS